MNLSDLNEWTASVWGPSLLRACWQGALAVAVVAILCRVFRRLPPALRAALWWLSCLKTLLSLAIPGPLSLPVLPGEPPAVSAPPSSVLPASYAPAPSAFRSEAAGPRTTVSDIITPPAAPSPAPLSLSVRAETLSPASILFGLWLAGVAFILLLTGRELCSIRRIVAEASPCDAPIPAREAALALGLRRVPPVLVSDNADCTLIVGPWRPRVVLCRADLENLSPPELRALLAHELAHVRRRDLWTGLLPNLTRLLFFFHPLVWLACREYDLSREAACDADALQASGMPPAAYGRLLLKLVTGFASPSPACRAIAALGASSPSMLLLRRRLQGLKNNGSPVLPRRVTALLLAATAIVLSLNPVRVDAGATADAVQPRMPSDIASGPLNTAPMRPMLLRPDNRSDSAIVQRTTRPAETPSVLLPGAFLALTDVPNGQTAPASPAPKHPDPENVIALSTEKEVQPMSHLTNVRQPRVRAAAVALAAALPTLSIAAPAGALETPPSVPVAPAATSTPSLPAPSPAPAVPSVPQADAAPAGGAKAQASRYQYTWRRGESIMSRTQDKTVAAEQRTLAKAQSGDCLIVDREGRRYIITDAATLNRIREAYAPVEAIGKQMEGIGKQMEEAAKPLEAIGKEMEGVGKKMEAIGRQMEEQGKLLEASFREGKSEADRQAIQDKMRALQEQMNGPKQEMQALAQKMRDQSAKLRPMGDQQRAFGNQIRAAVKEAEVKVEAIIDAAFQNNLAVEQKQP
jgi:beta-lactamase regulating signal transducer with metallopeptidase domain/uncharacterized protein YoxC